MAGKNDIEAGRAHVKMYVDNSAVRVWIAELKSQLQGVGSLFMKLGPATAALGVGLISSLAAAVAKFAAMGTELSRVSERTGVAASSLAEMRYAAESVGASLGDVEGALASMRSKHLNPADFDQYAAYIASIENPTLRAARAQDIFGSSGAKLLPMLRDMGRLRQEARDLGLVPTEEAVADAAEIGRSFESIKSAAVASIFEIGAALGPLLKPGLAMLQNLAGTANRWIRENSGVIRTIALIAVGLVAAGTAATAIGGVLFAVGSSTFIWATAVGAVTSALAFLVSPLGIVLGAITAIGAGVYAWIRYTESGRAAIAALVSFATPLFETLKTTVGGVFDALKAGDVLLAGQIALKGLQLIFFEGFTAISEGIGGQLGDVLGTIGKKILGGDFAGAFQTALKQMLAWTASFAEGVIALFTQAARSATSAWKSAVDTLSGQILETSASGGTAGKLVSKFILGGMDMQEIEAERRRLDERARSMGLATSDQTAVEEAKATARQLTQGTVDKITGLLDKIDVAMQEMSDTAAESARSDTEGGASQARAEVDRLKAELDALRNQAKAAATAAASRKAGGLAGGLAGMQSDRAANFATFSAAAIQAGIMQGPQDRIARAVEKQLEKADAMLRKMDEQKKAIEESAGLGVIA